MAKCFTRSASRIRTTPGALAKAVRATSRAWWRRRVSSRSIPQANSEARTGFEPAFDGFANRCLTTWLPRQALGSRVALSNIRAPEVKHWVHGLPAGMVAWGMNRVLPSLVLALVLACGCGSEEDSGGDGPATGGAGGSSAGGSAGTGGDGGPATRARQARPREGRRAPAQAGRAREERRAPGEPRAPAENPTSMRGKVPTTTRTGPGTAPSTPPRTT